MCCEIKVSGLRDKTGAAVFKHAQAGCIECLDTLMTQHSRLVLSVVRRQVLGDLSYVEAIQAGRIGLWKALMSYRPERGYTFATYAWPCIMRHIWRAVKTYPKPIEIGRVDSARTESRPDQLWERQQVMQALHRAVGRLPERLRQVVIARYGLDGGQAASYVQIGHALGLSRERVRQLHTEAMVWLRHPAHSYVLRGLLECHTGSDYEDTEAQANRWLERRGGRYGRIDSG